MKLTRAASYALQALGYMAQQPDDRAIASHVIARERGIPERFLLKVLKPLVEKRLLTSIKGPNGGYRLAKPVEEISLLEILETAQGEFRGDLPESTENPDPFLHHRLEGICRETTNLMRSTLSKVKLSDLVEQAS